MIDQMTHQIVEKLREVATQIEAGTCEPIIFGEGNQGGIEYINLEFRGYQKKDLPRMFKLEDGKLSEVAVL